MKVPLHVKVHPVVKEFYQSITGSDVIELKPNDDFSYRIKSILQLAPKEYKNYPLKNEDYVTLLLPKSFRLSEDKRIQTKDRNYLDDRRQYFLSKELYDLVKSIFHNYVMAFARAGGKYKDGINDFCTVYNISMNKINYEMLKKSWDRSFEKKILKKNRYQGVP